MRRMVVGPPKSRVKCGCCGGRATHIGVDDETDSKIKGCEWLVRLWVRDPAQARTLRAERMEERRRERRARP